MDTNIANSIILRTVKPLLDDVRELYRIKTQPICAIIMR